MTSPRVAVLRYTVDVTVPVTYSEEAKQTVRREIMGKTPKNKMHNHPNTTDIPEAMKDIVVSRVQELSGYDSHDWTRRLSIVARHEDL